MPSVSVPLFPEEALSLAPIDCPIEPHVLKQLAAFPNVAVDVVIEVRRSASPPHVASFLRREDATAASIILDRFIFTTLNFRTAVSALLPLTEWRMFMVRAWVFLSPGEADRRSRLAEVGDGARVGADWTREDAMRLRWMLLLATGSDQDAQPSREEGFELSQAVMAMFADAAEIAESSDAQPIVAVTSNRPAVRS